MVKDPVQVNVGFGVPVNTETKQQKFRFLLHFQLDYSAFLISSKMTSYLVVHDDVQ